MMQLKFTFEDGSEALAHYGVKGMKWGVWNEETKERYALEGNASSGGGGGIDEEETIEEKKERWRKSEEEARKIQEELEKANENRREEVPRRTREMLEKGDVLGAIVESAKLGNPNKAMNLLLATSVEVIATSEPVRKAAEEVAKLIKPHNDVQKNTKQSDEPSDEERKEPSAKDKLKERVWREMATRNG